MIRLRFGSRPGFESWLIRWLSAGQLSHVDIVMPDGRLLGVRPDGVKLRDFSTGPALNVIDIEIDASEAQTAEFHRFALEQVGKRYDNRALLGFMLNKPWHDEERWTCSELPAKALMVAGVIPALYLDAPKITPVTLALVVSALPGVRMIRSSA